jgi:hypothetical protein
MSFLNLTKLLKSKYCKKKDKASKHPLCLCEKSSEKSYANLNMYHLYKFF